MFTESQEHDEMLCLIGVKDLSMNFVSVFFGGELRRSAARATGQRCLSYDAQTGKSLKCPQFSRKKRRARTLKSISSIKTESSRQKGPDAFFGDLRLVGAAERR